MVHGPSIVLLLSPFVPIGNLFKPWPTTPRINSSSLGDMPSGMKEEVCSSTLVQLAVSRTPSLGYTNAPTSNPGIFREENSP